MKTAIFFLSFLFLLSCVSSKKKNYSHLIKASSAREMKNKRSVAYLKEMSQFKESSFQFIFKQMKEIIQNYEHMREQLEKIEQKLKHSLNQDLIESDPYQKTDKKDSITLIKKNGVKAELFLSSAKDYIRLMGEILKDEYKMNQRQKEKLLSKIQNHIDQNKMKEEEKFSPVEIMGAEDDIYLDDEDDFFEENESSQKEDTLNQDKEDTSALNSAKKYFKEKAYDTAIFEFQKYRNKNPEGAHYPEATFYIGRSFENLKMPIEAEVFFKEIVQSHPQSLWASRAKKFLKE